MEDGVPPGPGEASEPQYFRWFFDSAGPLALERLAQLRMTAGRSPLAHRFLLIPNRSRTPRRTFNPIAQLPDINLEF